MVTILLEQIIEILKGWLSSFTSWAEDTAEKLGLIEEATEYIDDIYDDTEAIKTDTGNIATSNQIIVSNTQGINNRLQSIDPNVTAIKNNVGTISTNTGIAAAFSEDIATNTMNTLDKVTTIASDTTQIRADNTVVKADLDKIYDALKWSLIGIDTTETEEGIGSVSFDTDKTDTLDQFDIAFIAVQSGSGTPSPDNVRPITGWSDFNITANDSILILDLGGTYYGGSVNVINGKIILTHQAYTFNGSETWTQYAGGEDTYFTLALSAAKHANEQIVICDHYQGQLSGAGNANYPDLSTWLTNTDAYKRLYVKNSNFANTSDAQSGMNGVTVVYPLATPIEVQASNVLSINTQKGLNTITSDSNGKMTVTYTESVKHYLDKQEG